MRILYWNTCLTTGSEALFEHLMLLRQTLGGVDYFCLNEATETLTALFKKSGYQTFYKANTARRGVLIASRQPLRQKRSYLLSSVIRKEGVNENHLLMVEVSWRQQPLTVATTHLSYLRLKEVKRRRQERRKLSQILPRNRTVFGGDLNTVIIPFAKWDVVRSGYRSQVRGKTWRWHLKNTWKRIPFKLQLDYVFSTHDLSNAVSAKILKEQKLSDHFPILVRLD